MKKQKLEELKSLLHPGIKVLTAEERRIYDKLKFKHNGSVHVAIIARPTPEIRDMVAVLDKKLPLHVVYISIIKTKNDAYTEN